MKLRVLLGFLFCLLTGTLLAQRDCVLPLNYRGTFRELPFKVSKIVIPTTEYLQGYVAKGERLSTITRKVQGSSFSIRTITSMSSHFCGETQDVVENVFKKFKNPYFVRFLGTNKGDSIEIQIPVDKIIFLPTVIGKRKGLQLDFAAISN